MAAQAAAIKTANPSARVWVHLAAVGATVKFTGLPSPSTLKHLLQGEGGAAE